MAGDPVTRSHLNLIPTEASNYPQLHMFRKPRNGTWVSRTLTILSGPGIPKGETSDALVYLFDLFPTLCDLAGLAIPEGVEGESLVSILRGEAKKVRESAYTAYKDVQRAVRDERWKLIRYPKVKVTQLFDLENDPHEMNNLAEDPAHAAKVNEMMSLLQKWQQKLGDNTPLS